jgi:hypothetical protein
MYVRSFFPRWAINFICSFFSVVFLSTDDYETEKRAANETLHVAILSSHRTLEIKTEEIEQRIQTDKKKNEQEEEVEEQEVEVMDTEQIEWIKQMEAEKAQLEEDKKRMETRLKSIENQQFMRQSSRMKPYSGVLKKGG